MQGLAVVVAYFPAGMETAGKKTGLPGYEVPGSPKIASPRFGPSYGIGYFSDLAVTGSLRLTVTSSSVAGLRRYTGFRVVVEVGTVAVGLRPGREPAEQRPLHMCPLIRTSGPKS